MNTPTKTPTPQDILRALQRGKDAIREAAQMVVAIVDADPRGLEKIHKETGIHWNVLSNLERVGRGTMHFELLLDTSPAARHIAMLPASQQRELYEKPVQVVSIQGGKAVVEQKPVQQLSPQEVRVLFDGNHRPRPVEEQVKVAKSAESKPRISQPAQRYIINGDTVTVLYANTTFTAVQLEEILGRLKSAQLKQLTVKK